MTTTYPKHVAIIMDGNGRWAKQRHLPRVAGHRAGSKSVRRTIEFAVKHNIEALTLFALSTENLKFRPPKEVNLLMELFLESLEKNTDQLHDNNVRVRIVGDRSVLSKTLQQQIASTEQLTHKNSGLQLSIAINYSGHWDITQATKQLVHSNITADEVTEDLLSQHLALADLPDPDLLIRTSGELRISNFMLWQFAYTELYFTDKYWPEFDDAAFQSAIDCFMNRQRRFGKTNG